jgi:hypothetical protein
MIKLGTAFLLTLFALPSLASEPSVHFSRQIRPILAANCFTCHGPDEANRKAKMRLDTKEGAFSVIDGKTIIKPGDSANSEMYKHISSTDPDEHMPPPKSGKKLTPEQIGLIKSWIDEGAPWESHWAFQKPVRPPLPKVQNTSWPKNEIDYFILKKLEDKHLSPSPRADKATLARRATLDLTGLPPSVDELDAFLADDTSGSYDKLVNRLMSSSRYGEQMGRYWLDAARYADSHGYHIDAPRMVWKYREWVINALNKNEPFDQFTIEQIAGDMLPHPTLQQKVATGFNRCNMTTGEGGAIEAEYRVKYAVDRVETVGTVWLGLTIGCAQCHSHKFDPIAQKEFYEFSAFFNSIAEPALDGNAPAPPPFIKVPSDKQAAAVEAFHKKIDSLKERLNGPNESLDCEQAAWEKDWTSKLRTGFSVLKPIEMKSRGGATFVTKDDGSVLVNGKDPDTDTYEVILRVPPGQLGAIRLEAIRDDSLPKKSAARSSNGNFVLTEFQAEASPIADPSRREPVQFIAAQADYEQDGFPISNAIDGEEDTGWAVEGHNKHENRSAIFLAAQPFGYAGGTELRVKLGFNSHFPKHSIGRFRLSVAPATDGLRYLTPDHYSAWQLAGAFPAASGREAFTTEFGPEKRLDLTQSFLDGKVQWRANPDLKDGAPNALPGGENSATYLYRAIRVAHPHQAVFSFGSDDGIKAWLNGKLILDHDVQRGAAPDQEKVTVDLAGGENQLLLKIVNYSAGAGFYFKPSTGAADSLTPPIARILAFSNGEFSDSQKEELKQFYRQNFSPGWKDLSAQLARQEADLKSLEAKIPVTMISKELDKPRDTFLLVRGQYDKHGEQVYPNTPAVLPPLPATDHTNRLTLAKWLVSTNNPLTARVTVNRFWQHYFGTGLVKTTGDFGTQGEAPSHPELLDWLAVEFMESGWDMKHIQKLIVSSAAYQQSSRLTPELLEADPENRLLSRGPRFRMDAEMIRDSALKMAGLLVEKFGGPSVKPYQPAGLWTEVSYGFKEDYKADTGEGLYRRSMYTYWKRQSPPPGMIAFDAPSREVCTVRRQRTNTPLQALELMNDPQYIEASRGFARRMMLEAGSDPADRISFAYRYATARKPSETEIHVLRDIYDRQLKDFQTKPAAALKYLGIGDSPLDPNLDPCQWAAWTSVASVILNLDATVTKS